MSPDEVAAVDATDGHRCAWCAVLGRPSAGAERHHRLPRSRARNVHDHHNVVLLCTAHHHEAHRTSAWPWSVPGTMIRGEYRGADPLYGAIYTGAGVEPIPSIATLSHLFPDASRREVEWAHARAVAYAALDRP